MTQNCIANLPEPLQQGVSALQRIFDVAHNHSGQSRIVARFLMSLYEGDRFPFDLSDFRRLDREIFDDCVTVLKLDQKFSVNVHRYFQNGEDRWEALARRWGFTDHSNGSWR